MRLTYHLVAAEDWPDIASVEAYEPASVAAEGFIHCTDGLDAVIETANRYYRGDPRPYLLVSVDLDAVRAPWRYDDAEQRYPHIYGALNLDAVVGTEPCRRELDGTFVG